MIDNDTIREIARIAAVRHIRRCGYHGWTWDEHVAEALYGIARGLARVDPSRERLEVLAYLYQTAEGQLDNALRAERGWRTLAGHRPAMVPIEYGDTLTTGDEFAELEAVEAVTQAWVTVLDDRERGIITAGFPVEAAGALYGVTGSMASRIRKGALRKIREHLAAA